jgi:hypothetical protein
MTRYSFVAIALGLISVAIPLRAANRPHAGTDSQNNLVWTNDDLERLHVPGLICIVGQMNDEAPESASPPGPYVRTQDPAWYAEQAAKLRDELERRRAQLGEYRQALEVARSLRETTGGINLEKGNIGITPEAGIEILRQRVSETQTEFDALEDLARRHDIPPGTLRGQGDSGIQMDGLN